VLDSFGMRVLSASRCSWNCSIDYQFYAVALRLSVQMTDGRNTAILRIAVQRQSSSDTMAPVGLGRVWFDPCSQYAACGTAVGCPRLERASGACAL
jgi:hypothetical protein